MPSLPTRAASIAVLLALTVASGACSGTSDDDGAAATTTAVATSKAVATTISGTSATAQLVAPDTESFKIDGGTATLVCKGSGPMPIIFIAGPEDSIARWDVLVDDLGQQALACRFAPPTGPDAPLATPTRQADALSQTLDASGLRGPHVLVAHSLGSITVRRFGDRHPDQLAAALLLDGTTPTALLGLDEELTEAGWDPDPTRADAEAPASWPDVPLTVFARAPTPALRGRGPAIADFLTAGPQYYLSLTDDARLVQVEGTGQSSNLGTTRQVSNEILHLADQVS